MAEEKRATLEDYLADVYFDPRHPAAFGGIARLRKSARAAGYPEATEAKVRDWLQGQESYSLFRPARKRFPRNETPMYKKDWIWEADLMDMVAYADENDRHQYVLVVVDVFTRYAWTTPLKSKQAVEVADALDALFKGGRKPESALRTDKGGEFVNYRVRKVLDAHGVRLITSFNETKAGMVERLIKTLKTKLMRNVYHRSNYRWLDALSAVTDAYNSATHRSIGMTPNEAVEMDDDELRLEQYLIKHPFQKRGRKKGVAPPPTVPKKAAKPRFAVNDVVRVSYLTTKFSREYDERFSQELFRVRRAFLRERLPVYQLEDWAGEVISGTFYQQEIARVFPPGDDVYRVEKVLRRRGRGANAQAFVKFYGWPKKFNAWVAAESVRDIV